MKFRSAIAGACALAVLSAVPVAQAQKRLDAYETAKEAYIYAFPMIAGYKAMYQFSVDKTSSQYKGGFNQIHNTAQVFTPKDTAIVTPNSDTPYSMIQMDLRAEPIVFCVPEIEKNRYYSVQLTDMYAFNYGYVGTRATGNGAGCYMIAGPGWSGEKPEGIAKAFASETQFGLVIFRTQLFNAADIDNVKKIQAGYKVMPLSMFLGKPAPPPAPPIDFPEFTDDAFKLKAFDYLNFLLQFAPEVAAEKDLRAKFATIGIVPGKPFAMPTVGEGKVATELGIKEGFEAIQKRRNELGKLENGWQISPSRSATAPFTTATLRRGRPQHLPAFMATMPSKRSIRLQLRTTRARSSTAASTITRSPSRRAASHPSTRSGPSPCTTARRSF